MPSTDPCAPGPRLSGADGRGTGGAALREPQQGQPFRQRLCPAREGPGLRGPRTGHRGAAVAGRARLAPRGRCQLPLRAHGLCRPRQGVWSSRALPLRPGVPSAWAFPAVRGTSPLPRGPVSPVSVVAQPSRPATQMLTHDRSHRPDALGLVQLEGPLSPPEGAADIWPREQLGSSKHILTESFWTHTRAGQNWEMQEPTPDPARHCSSLGPLLRAGLGRVGGQTAMGLLEGGARLPARGPGYKGSDSARVAGSRAPRDRELRRPHPSPGWQTREHHLASYPRPASSPGPSMCSSLLSS